jgi:hypothetical protein
MKHSSTIERNTTPQTMARRWRRKRSAASAQGPRGGGAAAGVVRVLAGAL